MKLSTRSLVYYPLLLQSLKNWNFYSNLKLSGQIPKDIELFIESIEF